MNTRIFIILLSIVSFGYSLPVVAITFDEDEYTLLELQYKRQSIGNGVESYLYKDTLYILLLDIVSALELNISVDENSALGTITKLDDEFRLERKNSEWLATTKNKTTKMKKKDIVVHNGYIYVRDKQIEKWFGLRFQLDYSELILSFKSSNALPILQKLARQNRKFGPRQLIEPAKNPIKPDPYALVELPSADLRSTTFLRDTKNTGTTTDSFYTLITHGDLAYMNTALFLNGSQDDDIKNASIRMDRFDKTGNMAGPLKLSQISVGDLTHPTVPFAPGSNGRGVTIGNDATSRQTTRNTTTIEGDYYPGQEVELYFNNSLIGYQVIPENGHYVFEDVITFIGDNHFLLKFYGINGTVETEKRTIRVGDTRDGSNRLKYNLSLSQPEKTTIDIDNRNGGKSSGIHSSFTTRYTFNNYLSGNFGSVYTEGDGQSNTYYNLGLQTYLLGNSLSINASSDDNGLLGYIYGIGGSAFNTRYSLSSTIYNDQSDGPVDPDNIPNRLEQTYNLSLNTKAGDNSFTLKSSRKNFTFGHQEKHRMGMSTSLFGNRISNTLTYELKDDGILEKTEELDGGLFISRSIHPLSVRLNLSYEVIPESELKTAGLTFSYSPSSKTSANFGVNHNILDDTTDYELSASWKFKYLQITPRIRYDRFHNATGILDIFTSIGKRTGKFGNYYNLNSRKNSSRGALRARLFEDNNLNGSYDEGEDLLEGGTIFAPQYRSKGTSNEGGIAWIDHTQSWELSDIVYEDNSLDAYSMRYSGEPFSVAIRPGKVTEVDMPFTRTGDVDGTVFRQFNNGTKEPARGATVIAIDNSGNAVAENRADLDGYFSFDGLMPNTYLLTVKHSKVISRSKGKITITNKGEYISDYRLVIAAKKSNTDDAEGTIFESGDSESSERELETDEIDNETGIKNTPNLNLMDKGKTDNTITPLKEPSTQVITPISTPVDTKTFPLPKPAPVATKIDGIRKTPFQEQANIAKKSKQYKPLSDELATKRKTPASVTAKPFPNPAPIPEKSFDSKNSGETQVESNQQINDTNDLSQYVIKVGSYLSRANAITSIKNMKAMGHPTYTEVANTPTGMVTRVFVGPIKGRNNAENTRNSINTKYNEKSFVVPFES